MENSVILIDVLNNNLIIDNTDSKYNDDICLLQWMTNIIHIFNSRNKYLHTMNENIKGSHKPYVQCEKKIQRSIYFFSWMQNITNLKKKVIL